MSYPTTFEFAFVAVGNGATPEVFTRLCGIQTSGFNHTVATSDRFRRDCAKPALVPVRGVKVNGRQWDLTGSGLYNLDQIDLINGLPGVTKTYQLILLDISDPAIEAGTVIGTWEGPGVLTAVNLASSEDQEATIELTIASDGLWEYTEAP